MYDGHQVLVTLRELGGPGALEIRYTFTRVNKHANGSSVVHFDMSAWPRASHSSRPGPAGPSLGPLQCDITTLATAPA